MSVSPPSHRPPIAGGAGAPAEATAEAAAGAAGTRRRPPVPVALAAVLVTLLALVTAYGAFYFSFVFENPPVRPGAVVFVAAYWALDAAAVAAGIGLLRGRRLGRQALLAYVVWGVLFCMAKIIFWHETEALVFGGASLVLLALLAAPSTRRYAS